MDASKMLPMPSRLVTEDDLKPFYEAMRIYDTSNGSNVPIITKRKVPNVGGLDTEQYGRGKRAREIRSYEDQMTEEEFEKMCQVDSPESAIAADPSQDLFLTKIRDHPPKLIDVVLTPQRPNDISIPPIGSLQPSKDPPVKRGRGRPRRSSVLMAAPVSVPPAPFPPVNKGELEPHKETSAASAGAVPHLAAVNDVTANVTANTIQQLGVTALQFYPSPGTSTPLKARGRPSNGGETTRGRGRMQKSIFTTVGAQLNAYTAIQSGIDATMSRPAANVLAKGNSTLNVVAGVPNFVSIGHNITQMPGSSAVVETPAVKASSSQLPEIVNSVMPVVGEKEARDDTAACETKSACIVSKLTVTKNQVSILQPKNPDGAKTDSEYSTAEPNFGSSVPDTFSPKQGQTEKRVDGLLDKTQKTKHNFEGTLNDKQPEVAIKDVNSIQMLDKTLSDQINQERTPSIESQTFNNLESDDKPHSTSTVNSSLESHGSSVVDKVTGREPQISISIEAAKFQENSIITGTPALVSTNMIHEKLTNQVPTCQVLDYRAVPVVIHRDSENRASVTRKKAAARETRNRCSTSTAACERRARQAGLKLADGSKKAETRGRTSKAATMKAKEESGSMQTLPGTPRSQTAQGSDVSFLQIETSTAKTAPSAARNFEQTLTKEIKFDQGITCASALDPNKMSLSKGNVESNTISSSSNMECGLVLGLPVNATIRVTDDKGDNFKSTGIDQLQEEPVKAGKTCVRPEGFSVAEDKQLVSSIKCLASERNSLPEVFETQITGGSFVKSDAQNSNAQPAVMIVTEQERPVPCVLEAIDKPAEELETSDLGKMVRDDSHSDNLKAQSEIIQPSSGSVTPDENNCKAPASLENEKDHKSTSADLVKALPSENSAEISQQDHSALQGSNLIGSSKPVAQEHNASDDILTVSSELVGLERQQQAVAIPPIEEQYASLFSPADLKLSEPVEQTTEKHHATDSLKGSSFTESVGNTAEKIKAIEHYRDDKPSVSSISSSDNSHGLSNALTVSDIESDMLRNVDGIILALPTESEPLPVHPDATEIKRAKATAPLGMKTRSSSGDKKILEAARVEDTAIENKTAEDATKHIEQTGMAQSSNMNQELNLTCDDANPSSSPSLGDELAVSGEELSRAKAIKDTDFVLRSSSDVGFPSATIVQEDSDVCRDASCSSPSVLEETQKAEVSIDAENLDSAEKDPEFENVEDSKKLGSAEIKPDDKEDCKVMQENDKVDEDPGS